MSGAPLNAHSPRGFQSPITGGVLEPCPQDKTLRPSRNSGREAEAGSGGFHMLEPTLAGLALFPSSSCSSSSCSALHLCPRFLQHGHGDTAGFWKMG